MGSFKDPDCYLCLIGCVLTSWSLKQQSADSNNLFHENFVAEFTEHFKENSTVNSNPALKGPLAQTFHRLPQTS